MPRKARIDAPGALNHIIVRGIARGNIFHDDTDRNFFTERLGTIISETQTKCFAPKTCNPLQGAEKMDYRCSNPGQLVEQEPKI